MFELKSIREINHRLGKLGTPSHPESRVHPGADEALPELADPCSERRILRLQDQNRMLTDEVGRKSQLITALEQVRNEFVNIWRPAEISTKYFFRKSYFEMK